MLQLAPIYIYIYLQVLAIDNTYYSSDAVGRELFYYRSIVLLIVLCSYPFKLPANEGSLIFSWTPWQVSLQSAMKHCSRHRQPSESRKFRHRRSILQQRKAHESALLVQIALASCDTSARFFIVSSERGGRPAPTKATAITQQGDGTASRQPLISSARNGVSHGRG